MPWIAFIGCTRNGSSSLPLSTHHDKRNISFFRTRNNLCLDIPGASKERNNYANTKSTSDIELFCINLVHPYSNRCTAKLFIYQHTYIPCFATCDLNCCLKISNIPTMSANACVPMTRPPHTPLGSISNTKSSISDRQYCSEEARSVWVRTIAIAWLKASCRVENERSSDNTEDIFNNTLKEMTS